MPNKKTTKMTSSPNFITNPNLQSLWVDAFRVATRDDGIVAINFYASQPEGHAEQARIVSGLEPLKNLINTLCNSIDYYPADGGSKKA